MVDGRRGGRRWSAPTLLPLRRTRQLSNTVSCWYCDFKFLAFNEPLFRFGRCHSRYMRVWFSMGVGFSLSALLGVAVFIIYNLARTVLVRVGNDESVSSFTMDSISNSGANISLSSIGYVCLSSVISIIVHEFGHALAAASEGVKMEYLSIFLAGLFPGALVAFNHASIQALPRTASLRIYCAGIWHNAIFCAACTLALFLLPFILSPLYIHGETAMVLDVPALSPLSGYLSPHDVIFSLDDSRIHTAEEWRQIINNLIEAQLSSSDQISGLVKLEKGYCVPHSLIEDSTLVQFNGNKTYCPGELTIFVIGTCLDVGEYNDAEKRSQQFTRESFYCLDAKDVIKLRKCANSSEETPQNQSGCLCSHAESCMMPMQLPGQGWVEIAYSGLECLNHRRNLFPIPNNEHADSARRSCLQTFVFIGDLISLAHSVHLTSYQPRWPVRFATYIPNILEKLLTCSFHVSMLVALLNSLPVFFLDGESILEVSLDYISFLSSRMKRSILRSCLLVGTFFSACYVLQTIYVAVNQLVPAR